MALITLIIIFWLRTSIQRLFRAVLSLPCNICLQTCPNTVNQDILFPMMKALLRLINPLFIILTNMGGGDNPALYFRIVESSTAKCIQYFYYWDKQDCKKIVPRRLL